MTTLQRNINHSFGAPFQKLSRKILAVVRLGNPFLIVACLAGKPAMRSGRAPVHGLRNSGTTRAVHRTTIPQAGHQMITEYALLDESDAKKKKKEVQIRIVNEQELLLAKRNCKMSSWLAPNKKYQHVFLESSCS
jgi:hypothetical protein